MFIDMIKIITKIKHTHLIENTSPVCVLFASLEKKNV